MLLEGIIRYYSNKPKFAELLNAGDDAVRSEVRQMLGRAVQGEDEAVTYGGRM